MTKWITQTAIAVPDTPTAIQIGTMESLVNGAVILCPGHGTRLRIVHDDGLKAFNRLGKSLVHGH